MKLDNKRTILIGFAFLAISAFWQVYDNIIPLVYFKINGMMLSYTCDQCLLAGV